LFNRDGTQPIVQKKIVKRVRSLTGLSARPRAINETVSSADVRSRETNLSSRLAQAWVRPDAPTLRERTYEDQATAIHGNKPIAIGLGYSTIAWIPSAPGSWALPLRHERITSWDTPISKAAWQLEQVIAGLPQRPLVLFDREYGCASLVLQTAHLKADKLIRLRSNRCLYSAPPAYSGRGRPRHHGEKFQRGRPPDLVGC
jgi:hypothetical protein